MTQHYLMQCVKKTKRKLKQFFCDHSEIYATTKENPSFLRFLAINARCAKCGVKSYEINKRAHERYKLSIADDVLFQRNIEKYKNTYQKAFDAMTTK